MPLHGLPFSSAFPARCQVRGCRSAPQEWYEQGQVAFEVCREHGLQLRAGEARSVEQGEVLLGPDAAPEVLGIRRTTTALGLVLTLQLGHHGVCTGEVAVKDSPALRAELQALLSDQLQETSGEDEGGERPGGTGDS